MVGGGTALVAQIVGEYFSRVAESRRQQWEQSQRFLDLKREVFARYLAAHTTFAAYLFRSPATRRRNAPESESESGELVDTYIRHVENIGLIGQEILLIAPSMAASCTRLDELCGPAFEVQLHISNPAWLSRFSAEHRGDPPLVSYRQGIATCRAEMTSYLGSEHD